MLRHYYPLDEPVCATAHMNRADFQCRLLSCKCKPGFVLFGLIHGFVRAFDQRTRTGAVFWEHRDSNTGLNEWVEDDVIYTQSAWRLNCLEDFCGNHRNFVLLMELGQHAQKLVTPKAADRIVVARSALEPNCNCLQDSVACLMSIRIV